MRNTLFLSLIVTFLMGCKQRSKEVDISNSAPESAELKKPMIRSIDFNGVTGDFGVSLNGDNAYIVVKAKVSKRIEIPHRDGLKLLEGFYGILGIEAYRGNKSDDRQTSIHYLVNIHDEMPGRYSEEWVDYVIPKDRVLLEPTLNTWFESMQRAKEQAEQ
jgi:hypothetical protein